jgi:addiction module HigA family antidote
MPAYLDRNPSHPGEVIDVLVFEPLGLSIAKASALLGVRRATLSDLVNGKAALSAEMAFRIHKAFGPDPDMLMNLQTRFDLAQLRKRAKGIKAKRYQKKAA